MARFLQSLAVVIGALAGLAGPAWALTTAEMMAESVMGSEKAPVTIVEYASLTCPHCAHFANNTFEALKSKYIDTGKVRFTYRDFPFDQAGLKAAMMARCAGPDRFFGFIAVLFKTQDNWTEAKDPIAELAKIGRLGGMSQAEFDACLANKELMDAVLQERVEAQDKYKVQATPTFIINGKNYEGARPIEEFDQILQPILAGGAPPAAPAASAAPATKAAPAAPAAAAPPPAASTPPPAEEPWYKRLWHRLFGASG